MSVKQQCSFLAAIMVTSDRSCIEMMMMAPKKEVFPSLG